CFGRKPCMRCGCGCEPIPISLLLISKQIHKDALQAVYSANSFIISSWPSDCNALEKLPDNGLAVITRLFVDMKATNTKLITDAESFASFISKRLTPKNLDLTLRCDLSHVEDPDAFRHVILSKLSILLRVSLQLAPKFNKKLFKIARALGTQLMGIKTYLDDPFPLQDLPSHVRQRIFWYTDLVPKKLKVLDCNAKHISLSEGCCGQCSPIGKVEHCSRLTGIKKPSRLACCCSTIVGFSSTDDSVQFPFGLFRASKELREDAMAVMLRENRIRLDDNFNNCLAFLQGFPIRALRQIQHLDIYISGYEMEGSREVIEFTDLLAFIAQSLDLHRLHLSLDGCTSFDDFLPSTEECRKVRLCYRELGKICSEVLRGKGLKRFYVFFAFAFREETIAEKLVMGEEYDSLQYGKIPYDRRDMYSPHGPAVASGAGMRELLNE
ncbi:hypothetical protein BC829DRAFT_395000, partial [Chytridium lagenaria]